MLLSPFMPPALLQAAPGGGNGMLLLVGQIAAMGLIFWLMILRPQAAQRKKHAELLAALKKGDDVLTVGGLVGRVKELREQKELGETHVTIESGSATVVVERSRIVRVGNVSAQSPG